MDVELRHLRSFVAVAEELNSTRAARRLFIAQQALSAQIRQLEDRIGVRLLERTTRSVQLTAAGETLYAQARLLLAGAEEAVAATRATAAATELTVGFVAAVDHPVDAAGLDLTPLWVEPVGVAITAGHPLATAADVSVHHLVAAPTFDFPSPDRAWRDYWMATATAATPDPASPASSGRWKV